jgi:hypothetical protein
MKPSLLVKDDRVIIRSNAESGTAPKLQAFNPADPFGLVARKAKGEKVVLPAAIEEIEQALIVEPVVMTSAKVIADRPPAPPMKTKIQTAIDYLKESGKTDTHTLRGVLRIKGKSAHPLSYLQDALSDGRIARSGNLWWAPGCEHVKAPDVAENPPIVADAKPEVQTTILDGLEEVGQMFREAKERARERAKEASQFACALWSNGELSLARKGSTLATLSPDEVSRLSKYLKRAMEAA